jgi:hypothetical protein
MGCAARAGEALSAISSVYLAKKLGALFIGHCPDERQKLLYDVVRLRRSLVSVA